MTKYSSSNLEKHQCTHPFVVKTLANFSDQVVRLMCRVPHSHVLNMGCGEGFDVRRISEDRRTSLEYCCGLDLSLGALQLARNQLSHLQFDLVNGDIHHLPLRLDRFDLILCLEVLEHLRFPEKVLAEISRESGGYCIFSVPNEPLYRLARLLRFRRDIRRLGSHPEHVNHWSRRAFCHLLKKGFIIDEVATPFPWTVILCHPKKE